MPRKITDLKSWIKTRYQVSPDGCWLWTGAKYGNGYGHTKRPGTRQSTMAHRISYEILVGPIPEGLVIDHLCKNKLCINPLHLEVVSQRENLRRAGSIDRIVSIAKERHAAVSCSRGHALSGANLYVYPNGKHRACRICMTLLRKEYQTRLKEKAA